MAIKRLGQARIAVNGVLFNGQLKRITSHYGYGYDYKYGNDKQLSGQDK
jgi:hypothetical protein